MTAARAAIAVAGAALAAAAVLAVAAFLPGCGAPDPSTADNVLLVSLDTMRADRLGCGGDAEARTPWWDRLARHGAQFANTVSPAPFTLPSHASMLGGVQPWQHRARDNTSTVAQEQPALAELLHDAGLATGAFVGSDVLRPETGLPAGFDRYDWEGRGAPERPAEYVIRPALEWLDGLDATRRYFLFVHLYDVHDPYTPAAPWDGTSDDPYRAEIAATDRWLLRFFRGVEERGRLARTMVIATSDHGEAFGEHGETGHGLLVYDTTLHVPLIVWGPEPFRGGVLRDDPARTIDLLQTVASALHLGVGRGARPGRLLQEVLPARRQSRHESYAESFYAAGAYGAADLRTLRIGTWKYIRAPRAELYDLAADPGETNNLFAEEPDRAAALAARLEAVLGDDLAQPAGLVDAPAVDERHREALAALGYAAPTHTDIDWADLSGRRDPKDFVGVPGRLDSATVWSARGDWDRALPLLQEVLDVDPVNATAVGLLAKERIQRGRTDEGLALFRGAIDGGGNAARLWADYGTALLRLGRDGEAQDALGRAVALNPDDVPLRLRLANAARRAGDAEKARAILEDTVRRHPEHEGAARALRALDPR